MARRWRPRVSDLTPRAAIELFRHAGEGLAAAHDAQLVHRDFKPSNVLVGSNGRARVADFGLVAPHENPLLDEEELSTAASSCSRIWNATSGSQSPASAARGAVGACGRLQHKRARPESGGDVWSSLCTRERDSWLAPPQSRNQSLAYDYAGRAGDCRRVLLRAEAIYRPQLVRARTVR